MINISVIIPVYNSALYLEECLQSLLNQSYTHWQALLIDDGSSDSSLEVCHALSQKDGRIQVYHQENKGAASARNYGLNQAKGEYIAFLDSDDAIHPLFFEEAIHQIEKYKVEMVFFNTSRLNDSQMTATLKKTSLKEKAQWKIADGKLAERWFHIDYADKLCGISGIISKKRISTLRFDETLKHGEDTLFKYHLFSQQIKTAYSPTPWYYYRNNPQSLCQQDGFLIGPGYYEKTLRIRDLEYQKKNFEYALAREVELSCQLRQRYERCQKRKLIDLCQQVKAFAWEQRKYPLFLNIDLFHKSLFYLCFWCYPLYVPINLVLKWGWKIKGGLGL